MNEQEQQVQKQESTPIIQTSPVTNPSDWSWGAFILDPFYLIALKKYDYLWMYLAYFIPGLNFFAMIGIKIYLGYKGHQLAAESKMFKNNDERNGFIKATDHAGFIMVIVAAVGIVLGFLFFGAMMSLLWGGGRGMMYRY